MLNPSQNDTQPPVNKAVAKTSITYTMVHPIELDPAKMDPADIAYHLGDGEFVGARTSLQTTPLEDSDVEAEVEALGGAPGWFKQDEGPTLDV